MILGDGGTVEYREWGGVGGMEVWWWQWWTWLAALLAILDKVNPEAFPY